MIASSTNKCGVAAGWHSVPAFAGTTFRGDSFNLTALTSKGPVFIADRGRPAHVLLSIEEYQRLTGTGKITDLLSMPEAAEVELLIPPLADVAVPADLA